MELLSSLKTGITRLRTKGGASPTALYDLVNGYIDSSGSPVVRHGARGYHRLPTGTKGLTLFEGRFVVFSHTIVAMTDPEFVCVVLRHPTDPNSPIKRVWFAQPFVGFLYVAAEFENGDTYHYWAVDADAWQANTTYLENGVVQPTVANGFTYAAHRVGEPGIMWAAGVARQVGDIVEPTEYNGFYYTCIATYGDNPASGPTEPDWPTIAGGQVIEETSGPSVTPPTTAPPPPDTGYVPPGYENPGGSRPGSQEQQ